MSSTMVAKQVNQRPRYYDDGITKITDPLWTVKCNECGHIGWSVTLMDHCPKCNSKTAVFTNPYIKISPSSPLKRAGKSAELLTNNYN